MANPSGPAREPRSPAYEQVKARLDVWRKSLLDLSRRNKLVYFGEGRGTRVQVVGPEIQELYQQIALDRRSLGFAYIRDVTVDELELVAEEQGAQTVLSPEMGHGEVRPLRISSGDLETSPAVRSVDELRQLYARLERLRKGTRTLSEEQGVHTL